MSHEKAEGERHQRPFAEPVPDDRRYVIVRLFCPIERDELVDDKPGDQCPEYPFYVNHFPPSSAISRLSVANRSLSR